MRALLFISTLTFASFSFAFESEVECQYKFMGADTFKVRLFYEEGSKIHPTAEVSMYGSGAHAETVQQVSRSAGELEHVMIAKDTDNEIEMIIYEQARAQGQSKLINNQMPMGREMWGSCR